MANESARGFRGGLYAIVVAICLLVIFLASESFSRIKQPGYYFAPRTATLSVSTKPRTVPRIATEPIPMSIEPMTETLGSAAWLDYRSQAQSSLALLEPPAGARLSAPIASSSGSDPFLDAIQSQRSPSALAQNAASDTQTTATNVSVVRPHESTPSTDIPAAGTIRTNLVPTNAWPNSTKLIHEIQSVEQLATSLRNDEVLEWLKSISSSYDQLTTLAISDSDSLSALDGLHQLSIQGVKLSEQLSETDSVLASEIARLSYSIERRYAVWNAVSACVMHGRTKFVAVRRYEVDSAKLQECLAAAQIAIQKTGDAKSWQQYLMLDSIKQLAAGTITGQQEQVALVREFLARVTDPRVSESQRAVLASAEIHKLADQVHPLSIGPVDYKKLVEDIETLESDPVHRCSKTLADSMQSLRFSEQPEQAAISQAVGLHYRNANLRIAVSEEFINRMMPKRTVMDKPVRQNILGADTRGMSQVATTLKADFQADENAWKIALNLDGDISSNTKSTRHGAAFYNASIANVNAVREIRISTQGMQINGKPATVASNDSLRKFSTDWDSLPILGDMVRHFAHEQFIAKGPIAKRLMHKTIAKQTDQEFDSQLQTKLADAQNQFENRLIGPLQSLDLHPMVVDMKTTESRLIIRYRVASSDQLSAYTPRPIAPGDSQLSLQVHQSAFNNMTSQVITGDREWTMQELSDKISDLLKLPRTPLDADAPTDVTVRFTDARPITVEFEEGRMWLTLRIASLEQPGRIHLKNFVIRTSYLPTIDGLNAELTRDGVISVDGHKLGMRDRLPLRAIFSRVFSNRSSIPMVASELIKDPRAEGLSVSQLELKDGWLAIAVSNSDSPHVAIMKSTRENVQR